MKISLNWLKEYVDINLEYKELADLFNLHSQEIAGLERLVDGSNLVVGYVEECHKHPDADKLSVCKVNVGAEVLQIICGAANVAKGQKVIVALDKAVLPGGFRIRKTKIRGVESNGMICSFEELGIEKKYHQEDGIHVLPDDAPVGVNALQYMHLDDYVLDLDLTPNRSDLLSYLGVAQDVKALTGEELHFKQPDVDEISEKNPVSVFTETVDCHSYYARLIKDVKIGPSPLWMQSRLIASGIRPISNIVDITNYVMLETGQPLHAFDYDKIKSNQIIVRNALECEKIVSLDGKLRELEIGDIVITDGSKPIALAGVMGGLETEVDSSTTNILLESATFDSYCIRRTSKRLDLRSESSLRFERGLDPTRTRLAANRAAALFVELAAGKVLKGVNYFDTSDHKDKEIHIGLSKIQSVTGYPYTVREIENVCDLLDFRCHESDGDFRFLVPQRRQDVNTYQDLIEEIVRIHGYKNIPLTLPQQTTSGKLTVKQTLRRLIRNKLLGSGLDEVVTYSLVSSAKATMFDQSEVETVKIMNPLSEERAYLRHSQLPTLLDVLVYNLSRKQNAINIFEIGKGYFSDHEQELLSGIMTGHYQPLYWRQDKQEVDFFIVKGILESLFEKLGISSAKYEKPEREIPHFHPGIVAEIFVEGQSVGIVGRCHPELESSLGLEETFMFEIDLSHLLDMPRKSMVMKPISKFPEVTRDLALIIDRRLPADAVLESIARAKIKQLTDVKVFDLYQGDKIAQDKKSIALTVTFKDSEKTLSSDEIDALANKLLKHLENELQAVLRTA
ncbi:MAG: phenylalanine--tRNA ligase subunit beta [Bacilli bacterium]|nr:phenylalanine--tRNA ligase subunit beta [Bacilli bacterium]